MTAVTIAGLRLSAFIGSVSVTCGGPGFSCANEEIEQERIVPNRMISLMMLTDKFNKGK